MPEPAPADPQPIAYYSSAGVTFGLPVEPVLRLLGRCAVALGLVFLVQFIAARRIGETFTFDLFHEPLSAIMQIADLLQAPCGLLLLLAGTGAVRLRPGVRRWVVAAGTFALGLILAAWIFGNWWFLSRFSVAYVLAFLPHRLMGLIGECLFPAMLILIFHHPAAAEILPERADGRHWWEAA